MHRKYSPNRLLPVRFPTILPASTRSSFLRTMLICALLLALLAALSTANSQCESARYRSLPRVFVLTDISNEPDDQMSLVRFLTHANELDIQGIAAVTSTWLNHTTDLPTIHKVISAYGSVVDNLDANVPADHPFPSADSLLAKTFTGQPVYGLDALNAQSPSNASLALIKATDASTRPLWVLAWGGANVLAESLNIVKQERDPDALADFVQKLRVYTISDQDDTGPWIRWNFPTLFYIVSIHGFSEYSIPTWIGISGELLRPFDKGGPDTSLITNEWLQDHIRIGALGSEYLNWTFQMEGDTPSFLSILPNGLNAPGHPEWGSWGGRYILADSSGRTSTYSDASDFVIGLNGDTFFSRYASIWRWRRAFQFDFAGRMQWTVNGDFSQVNHHPIVIVNETCSFDAMEISYKPGESVVLDASASYDPDGDRLSFDWFHYREVVQRLEGDIPRVSPDATFTELNDAGSIVKVTPNNKISMHIILTVEDVRTPVNLTTYKRVILNPNE
ncbi:hypothetical protein E1B28_004288 [Marasmius oreades]|uniref:Cellulose-binding protein n=1 Tax=Marasmius oreades TaxID=181124 RepID=A0A9P8ACS7_9AGAR|nr:uncharacterized protein E1B28_004288 [Marasmius oreades]KAG7096882.1 hypothetical protein E1B28_004288 [Marasmius oreades]